MISQSRVREFKDRLSSDYLSIMPSGLCREIVAELEELQRRIARQSTSLLKSQAREAITQATIADLQGQHAKDQNLGQRMLDDAIRQRDALQQRVAQLEQQLKEMTESKVRCWNQWAFAEQEVKELAEHHDTLQADHARVLGLVQALGVVGLPAEHTRPDDFILLKTGEGWMAHTYNYWAKFATEEEARAYIALLEYRASLPAQRAKLAQGGA